MLKQAFADHVRLRRGVEYAHGLPRENITEADTTAEQTQHVWPFDGVQLRGNKGATTAQRHRDWAEGTTGTVIRSAGRGDWTVRLDGSGASYEVDVPGTVVHLLTARGYSAGDVAVAARTTGTDRTESGESETTNTPSAVLLLGRTHDNGGEDAAIWTAYRGEDMATVTVSEADLRRTPWQARQRERPEDSPKGKEALVAMAQRAYAITGEWGEDAITHMQSAAKCKGLAISDPEAKAALAEAQRRWQGGSSYAHMVTLNHGGIVMRLREATAAMPGVRRMATASDSQDTSALSWEADARLWRTMHTLAANNDIVLLQETHLPVRDPEGLSSRVTQALTCGEFSGWSVATSPAPEDDTFAGILMWWNTATVELTGIEVLVPGRLQRARVRIRADGTELIVVNAYVPTRRGNPNARQAAILESVRAQIQHAIDKADEDGDEIAIGGDMQAQSADALDARKATGSNEYNAWLDSLCAENCLVSVGDDEPTYSAGEGGPQTTIDHWLVSSGLASRSAAEVGAGADGLAGDTAGAHGHHSLQLGLALRTADAEEMEEEWERREPQVPPMDEDEWSVFNAKEEDTATKAAAGADDEHQRKVDQKGIGSFGLAARRLGAIEGALKGLVTDIQDVSSKTGPQQGTKIGRLHAQMLRWRRWLRICDGSKYFPDTHPMFNTDNCADVLGDAPAHDELVRGAIRKSTSGAPRRSALREACRSRFLQARDKYEGAVTTGATDSDRVRTRLLEDIRKAVEDGRDPRWECFRAVGRAKAALAGKRTAPRLDRPGMRTIRRTGATVAETGTGQVLHAIHDESVVMHQERGASAAGALIAQERMAAAGLPAPWPHTVHERREDAEIAAADEARAMHEERLRASWTQWHKDTAVAPDAAYDPWETIHTASYPPLIDALRKEMTILITNDGIDRGLQRFRARQGVGVGGFSGIWVARASNATRQLYATTLRDIAADVLVAADALERARNPQERRVAVELIREAAPPGWTQWIIMLLTKPGKALDVLSKRRDICLQPHSLKLCANAVASHYVELQEHVQPEANTGFRERGAATTTALWLGLTKEEAASERKGWYCGFVAFSSHACDGPKGSLKQDSACPPPSPT